MEVRLKEMKNNERIGTGPMHKYIMGFCEIGAWV